MLHVIFRWNQLQRVFVFAFFFGTEGCRCLITLIKMKSLVKFMVFLLGT